MKNVLMVMNVLVVAFLFTGCTAYHLSTQSFIEQLKDSRVQHHLFVKGNDLKIILCFDKGNRPTDISINHRTSIRIHLTNHTRQTFYLNTVTLTDSTVGGSKTHFFNAPVKAIKFGDISKIEIFK